MTSPWRNLERTLGRTLVASERKSLHSLNDITPALLSELRGLARTSRIAAIDYLSFYVEKFDIDSSSQFYEDVLVNETTTPCEWGKRDIICFRRWDTMCLAQNESELLQALADLPGQHWYRVVPRNQNWDWSGIAGAPGVLIDAAPYWFETPNAVEIADLDSEQDELESIADGELRLAVRRWLASRIAWVLRNTDLGADVSVENVALLLNVDSQDLSEAARVAISALIQQGWPSLGCDGVPGFSGHWGLYSPETGGA